MVCDKCGREVRDDALFCKGCGKQLARGMSVNRESFTEQLVRPVNVGKKIVKTGRVLLFTCLFVGLALGIYLIYPSVSEWAGKHIFNGNNYAGIIQEIDKVDEIDKVSGPILVRTSKIDDCVVTGEKAYDDGSWEKDFLVNGSIVLRTLRRPYSEAWINTHIFGIYPDVSSVNAVDSAVSGSDTASTRIRFTSEKAENCTIEAVCIESGEYDHIFIVEMPNEVFSEYEAWLEEWIESLELFDADAVPTAA